MADTNTPHDGFFKRLFGNLAVAADFLRNYLPVEITSQLNLETLTIEKESFINPELRESFSDLLFKVKTVTDDEVFIYLLMEHKSAPDFWVAFQLLRYIVQFWERLRDQGCERLPLIIPIVFYHGSDRWNAPRRLGDLIEPSGIVELQKYIPDYEYDLRDFSPAGGEEIKGQPRLRAGLQLLRDIFSSDLGQRLPEVFRHLREMQWADAIQYARSLAAYVSSANKKISKEEVKIAMQEAFAREEFDKSALFIQEWIQEGREEGIEIGEHSGLYSLTLRQIQHILGKTDDATNERIQKLPNYRLIELGEALLDFKSFDDLHTWLDNHTEQLQ
jgi:predicted transposase YdaD